MGAGRSGRFDFDRGIVELTQRRASPPLTDLCARVCVALKVDRLVLGERVVPSPLRGAVIRERIRDGRARELWPDEGPLGRVGLSDSQAALLVILPRLVAPVVLLDHSSSLGILPVLVGHRCGQ